MKVKMVGELKVKFTKIEKVDDSSDMYTDDEIKRNMVNYIKENLEKDIDMVEVELINCEIIKEI